MIQGALLQQCLKTTQPLFCKLIPAGGPINLNANSYRINANFLVGDGKRENNIISLKNTILPKVTDRHNFHYRIALHHKHVVK